LQQVIVNLMTNAEHAMLEQGNGGHLTVTSHLHGGTIRIAVADTGPGIDEDMRDRIFDPFFTTKEVGKGTGLGLSVCYGVIEEHGGKIWVDPSCRRGARFVIDLPISIGKGNEPGLTAPAKPDGLRTAGSLLLVDDEAAIRDMLRKSLSLIGHSVDTAKNGEVALKMLKQKHYDCVITDVKMPGIDGPSLHKSIEKSDPDLAKAFIFISGDTVSPETRSYLREVRLPYLSKPFDLADFNTVLDKVLSSRPQG
jgi:two-component system NtrC family sensor kinase